MAAILAKVACGQGCLSMKIKAGVQKRLNCGWRQGAIALVIGMVVLLSGCQAGSVPSGQPVEVMRVVSGQTLEIADPTGATAFNQTVRLIGISAPDLKQEPWGQDAKAFLEAQVLGQPVTLESDTQPLDDYDRQLGYVWVNGELVNETLVKAGLALATVRSPNLKYEQRLKQAQDTARLLGKGIWNPEQPMRLTPAEFRQQQPNSAP